MPGHAQASLRARALCILAGTWCLDLVELQMKLLPALGSIMEVFCNWPLKKKKTTQEMFKTCSCQI